MRISRDEMMIKMARVVSERGTCNRLRVGAVLAVDSRVISLGYNGAPSGMEHCGSDCNPDNPCKNTLHAEHNALAWALEHQGSIRGGTTLYVTHSPCVPCAEKIVMCGVVRVVYDEEYRLKDGINFLKASGVEVEQCRVPSVS